MKPLEILSSLPKWAKATPDAIIDSPAFAMPCRLGDEPAVIRPASVAPAAAETLALSVAFGDEPHTLGIARSPRFPDLDKLWDGRADVPEPILLALVERECGPLLQLLENAVRKQLRLVGISRRGAEEEAARSDGTEDSSGIALCVAAPRREENDAQPICFSLTRSATVVSAFGALRNLDLAHESIRSQTLQSEVEYAAFAMPEADIAALSPGDAVMLPEIGSIQPRLIIDGRFVWDEGGVAPYGDDGMCRVRGVEAKVVSLGELFDAAGELKVEKVKVESYRGEDCRDGLQLRLLRNGKAIASGRFGRLGDHPALLVESEFGDR